MWVKPFYNTRLTTKDHRAKQSPSSNYIIETKTTCKLYEVADK